MRLLLLFAHPDDEVVAMGGTVKRLTSADHEVIVGLASNGGAGKVVKSGRQEMGKYGSVGKLREAELARSCRILGISQWQVLGYQDGEITNKQVWGKLKDDFVSLIDKFEPEGVVTFDHSGWYYHLDHVGVSVAAVLAAREAQHRVETVWFNLFRPEGIADRWPYVYGEALPVTHEVNIGRVVNDKVQAVQAHRSQGLGRLVRALQAGEMGTEYFQLVKASRRGRQFLAQQNIFKQVRREKSID